MSANVHPHYKPPVTNLGKKGAARYCLVFMLAGVCLLTGCNGVRYGLAKAMRGQGATPEASRHLGLKVADQSARQSVALDSPDSKSLDAPCVQYRGPLGSGLFTVPGFDESHQPLERWRVAVGMSYSQPVVSQNMVYVTEQRGEQEAIIAVDLRTGSVLWEHAWDDRFHEFMRKSGPGATPLVYRDMVVVLGAAGELRVLNSATGSLLWRVDIAESGSKPLRYGLCASPVRVNDTLIVVGTTQVSSYRLADGALLWQTLNEKMAYVTPVVASIQGVETVILTTATRVVGLQSTDGSELWSIPWAVAAGLSCTQPVLIDGESLLLSAGYGKGSQLVPFVDSKPVGVAWENKQFRTRFNEAIQMGNRVYGFDEGKFVGLNPETGEIVWHGGDYGYGQVIGVNEHMLVVDEVGKIILLTQREGAWQEVQTVGKLDGGYTLHLPCIAGQYLLVRGDKQMVCYDLSYAEHDKELSRAAPVVKK